MSRGGFGGGSGRGRFRGRGRGGGRGGGGFRNFDTGPPESVTELGYIAFPCNNDIICKVVIEDIPFFNASVFAKNKVMIGKVDEIFGPIRDYFISVKLSDNMKAASFAKNEKIFVDPAKLLKLDKFLPKPQEMPTPSSRGRGRGRGGRGGHGRFDRGRGRFDRGRGRFDHGRGGFGRGRGGFKRVFELGNSSRNFNKRTKYEN